MKLFKRNLQAGQSVSHALYDAGYSSSSRLYERTASQLGIDARQVSPGAVAAAIRYTCTDSPLGRMLVAATDKGICSIQFAETDDELTEGLKREFPFARRKRDDESMHAWTTMLLNQIAATNLARLCTRHPGDGIPAPCLDAPAIVCHSA